jgi:uncharacterized protein
MRLAGDGSAVVALLTNVTKFGAFIDIGIHQDGLVHISELSNRFIQDPSEAVKTGQIVKVKVLNADTKTRRIVLSIKALLEPSKRPSARPSKGVAKPQSTLDEKLSALSMKWKVR